jgi:tetratricopeptide (TPR) repeat protein
MTRRKLLTLAAALAAHKHHATAAPFPVHFRKPSPHEQLARYIQPGNDEFAAEAEAAQVHKVLTAAHPATRFYVLPNNRVRYETKAATEYRTGTAKYEFRDGRIANYEPESETVARSEHPLFRDVTAALFADCPSFRDQLLRGVPYWRAALDSAAGIDIYGSNGISVGDIDNDGIDEVYVCQPGGLPNRLYKLQDGRFQDITAAAGVGILDDTSCALFADFRNVGLQDLVVLRGAGPVLFLNRGDGTFALRHDAFQFHAKQQKGSFTGMSAADYDRDGKLDLYLCSYTFFQSEDQYRYPAPYHDARNGPPNFLFRNRLAADGSGAFEDATEAAGLNRNNDRFSFAPAWCDYDGDGWPDLFVANDFGRPNLYRNRGGRFEDVAEAAGVAGVGPGMSAAWFDADGDGRPDLYVSDMWTATGQRLVTDAAFRPAATPELRDAYRRHTKGNSLYLNRGDGTFEETGAAEMGRWAWSADAHDFDNDGTPEIFVTCGMLSGTRQPDLMSFFWRQVVAKSPTTAERSEAYENGWNAINQLIREDYSWNGGEPNVFYTRRNGRWIDASGISGLDCALDGRAFAVTDLDGDGNLDLLLKSRLAPQVQAFRNESTGGRKSIAVRLTGTKSNRDAIGARVEADGAVQWLQAGSGYLSQHTKVLHFGLGDRDEVARLSIVWPSGEKQEFHRLAAGHRFEITEGSDEVRREAFRKRAIGSGAAVAGDNTPRTHDTWLLEPVPLPDGRKGPGLLYVGEGERPAVAAQVVNLRIEPAEVAASYALFRRYLLDWRTELNLPLVLLIDDVGRVHKLYNAVPDAVTLAADLKRMAEPDRQRLALPFAGDYVGVPRRNYFKLGAAFYWAGYPQQALPYLEEVVRREPENDKALNAIGQIHLDAGRLAEARAALERTIRANALLGEAWNNLGGVELEAGNLDAALRCYRRAIELLPKATYPLVNAGQSEARRGHEREAVKLFQQAIEIDRNDAGAINNLGVLYSQMGQTNDAIAAFEYGIRVAPDDEVLYMNLGRVYVKRGDRAKAREAMLRLLERKPDSKTAANALRELESR